MISIIVIGVNPKQKEKVGARGFSTLPIHTCFTNNREHYGAVMMKKYPVGPAGIGRNKKHKSLKTLGPKSFAIQVGISSVTLTVHLSSTQ